MNDNAAARGIDDPTRKSEAARSWSAKLRADAIKVAEQVAETEERLAETLGRMAGQHPHHLTVLRANIRAAETYAARARRRVSELRAGSSAADDRPS